MNEMIKMPDDWESIELEKLLEYEQPTKYLVFTENYHDSYKTPVLTAGKTFILGYTNEEYGIFNHELPVIIFDDFTTASKFVNFPFKAKSSAMKMLKIKDKTIDIKIVYELMQKLNFKPEEHKRHWISTYSKLKINLPKEKKEQKKIAEVLSEVDNAISKIEGLFEKNKRLSTALMQDLLSYGVDKNGKVRSPQTHTFKPSELGDIPLEWDIKSIKDVLTIGSGKDYKHLEDGDIPVYGTGGYMTSVNGYLYDGESVCIGRKGTIDNPQFIRGKFWTVDTLFFTHSFKNCLPSYIYLVFLNINWKLYNEASGVPSLSKSTIEEIKIKIPKLKIEQQKVVEYISVHNEKIENIKNKLNKLKSLKASLMQDLLSGKVRVTKLMEENS